MNAQPEAIEKNIRKPTTMILIATVFECYSNIFGKITYPLPGPETDKGGGLIPTVLCNLQESLLCLKCSSKRRRDTPELRTADYPCLLRLRNLLRNL